MRPDDRPDTQRLAAVDEPFETLADMFVGRARPIDAALGIEADDLIERGAGVQHVARQFEEIAEFPVPANEAQIAIEDGDALFRDIDRVLQEIAIVLKFGRDFVDEFERRVAAACRAARRATTVRGAKKPNQSSRP